jgi:hypothetical protein
MGRIIGIAMIVTGLFPAAFCAFAMWWGYHRADPLPFPGWAASMLLLALPVALLIACAGFCVTLYSVLSRRSSN